MDIILSTGCLYKYPLYQIFQIARMAGFDGVELLISGNNCNLGASYYERLSDEHSIPILSLHSPFVICDGWGGFWDRISRALDIAMELSIPLVNFHPPTGFFPRHRLNNELSEHIQLYKKLLEDSGIALTIENLPTVRAFRRISVVNRLFPLIINNMYRIAEFAADNDIHVTFDTTHVGTTGVNLLRAYTVFRDRIANIHLSDHDGRSQHLLPGRGHLPLKELLSQVKQDGYDGTITLEACPAAMEHADRSKAVENAKRGLRYIRDALKTDETQSSA
jgi:sugar phosphate isomerase/epimerase